MNQKPTLISGYETFYRKAAFIPQQLDPRELDLFARLAGDCGQNLRILDLGCAEGKLAVLLARQGHRVTAADLAPDHIRQVQALAERERVIVKTVLCDIEKDLDSLGAEDYDVIFFMDVIEHLRMPAAAVSNLRNLLAEGGSLIINTPNLSAFSRVYGYMRKGRRKENFFDPRALGDLHLQGYDYQTLEKLLNFCGLQITDIIPTQIELPFVHRFRLFRPIQEWLARLFPLVSGNLLVKCRKVNPLDMDKQIEYWREIYGK